MRISPHRVLGLVLWLLASACGESGGSQPARDAASSPAPDGSASLVDAGVDAGARPEPDAAKPGNDRGAEAAIDASTQPAPDASSRSTPDASTQSTPDESRPQTNVSFESATRIAEERPRHLQDVRAAGQRDFYVFAGTAGDYVEITTDSGRFHPDSRIALYDAERTLVAENDDGGRWPGDGIDARLVVRLAEDGDYYVVVEEPYVSPGFFDGGFSLLYYSLSVTKLQDADGLAIARDADPAAGAFREHEDTGYAYLTVIFELGDEVRRLSFAGRDGYALVGQALGDTGSELTPTKRGALRIIDAEQATIAAIDRSLGQNLIDPPLHDRGYELSIGPVADAVTNAYAVVDLVLVPENPLEQDDAANDQLSGAERVALEGTIQRRGLVLLQLPAGDVDHLQLEVAAGEHVGVVCEGESGGSGVRALTAELLDGDNTVLASASEAPDANLSLPPTPVPDGGLTYIRISSGTAEDTIEPWVRCGVYVTP